MPIRSRFGNARVSAAQMNTMIAISTAKKVNSGNSSSPRGCDISLNFQVPQTTISPGSGGEGFVAFWNQATSSQLIWRERMKGKEWELDTWGNSLATNTLKHSKIVAIAKMAVQTQPI